DAHGRHRVFARTGRLAQRAQPRCGRNAADLMFAGNAAKKQRQPDRCLIDHTGSSLPSKAACAAAHTISIYYHSIFRTRWLYFYEKVFTPPVLGPGGGNLQKNAPGRLTSRPGRGMIAAVKKAASGS